MKNRFIVILLTLIISVVLAGCGQPAETGSTESVQGAKTLILGAYTTPREAYGKLIPIFQTRWQQKTGQEITFEESYLGSGAQSRAIVEGFEADVTALSLEADVIRIKDAGLITHDWQATPTKGMVSNSIVVLGVREGNPKNIHDWADLAQPDLEILTPNPKTSGGAQWNILALYGAARRGFVDSVPAHDEAAAQAFLSAVLNNVTVMDKGARESIITFEKGIGDVIITYENEMMVGQQNGQKYEYIIPRSTILIENPVAVVDASVDKHGTREAAEAFVDFLMTPEAQEIFAEFGLRSVDPAVAQATAEHYPPVEDLFTIEEFGGWSQATPTFFGDEGIFTRTISQLQRRS
ncbi:MAG: sulfate ABC transporter substrate-binding protein [Anaerolineales bacterium]|nr:sulfate ABC transporter substrate-binding protein [Anaerolineales bacterium]